MNVVIVESPAKAKTINKYLGPGYKVLASYGHVRDLPSKDGSVRPDEDFAMSWDVDVKSRKRLNEIAEAVRGADKLILATDPDREGEAISWHVLEVLAQKKVLKDTAVERVVFNAITKSAVTEAMAHPRPIDAPLVDAYLARRALDYLVGFTLSPVLWRKLPGARSAGRVQSVALGWSATASWRSRPSGARNTGPSTPTEDRRGRRFSARLAAIDGTRLTKFDIPDQAAADTIEAALADCRFLVEVESKPAAEAPPLRRPSPPRRCSRRPRASSAFPRRAPCRSPSGSTRASTSAARRKA
jgi:DNA topoisomerase I